MAARQLLLMRHAKSSWDDPHVGDHDRPLAGRGRKAGAVIARHLQEKGVQPDLVLCSTSRRTRETLELLEPVVAGVTTRFEENVYGASAAQLLERVRGLPDDVSSVLIVGHNPGMQQLVLCLARDVAERETVAWKFPTGALATLSVDAERWADLEPESADLVGYVRPRDLP